MKDVYTLERREQIDSLNRGPHLERSAPPPTDHWGGNPEKLYPETIEKLREIALNRPPMSDETKQNCITHTSPVVLYNLNITVYGEYSTILYAAKAINCNEKTIRRALKTEKKLVKRNWIVKDFYK